MQKNPHAHKGRVFDGPRKPRTAKNRKNATVGKPSYGSQQAPRYAGTDRYADRRSQHTGHGDRFDRSEGRVERRFDERAPRENARDERHGSGRGAGNAGWRGDDRRREYPARDDRRNAQHDGRYSRDDNRGGRDDRHESRNDRAGYRGHNARDTRGERYSHDDRRSNGDNRGYGRSDRNDRFDRNNRFDRSDRFDRNDRRHDDRAPYADRNRHNSNDAGARREDRSDRSRYEKPRYDKPRYEKPGYDKSRDDRAGFDTRSDHRDRPRYDKPRKDKPRFDKPRYEKPGHDKPRSDIQRHDGERAHTSHHFDKPTAPAFTPDVKLEKLEAVVESTDELASTFDELGVDSRVIAKLAEMGITAPFPIQSATIPDAIKGRNVLGRGRTGSGKTVAFAAPIVTRLQTLERSAKRGRAPRALIVAPTRELASQIDKTVQPLARAAGLFTIAIFGGVPQFKQVTALTRGVDIIIATPGRLEDLVEQGYIDLADIKITVLDEADHMCDLGFLEPIQRILRSVDPEGQRMLFSATLDAEVSALVDEFLDDPIVHEVADEDQDSSTIEHVVLLVDPRDKVGVIEQLAHESERTIVFTRTRAYAETLCMDLEDAGIPATSLHGDLNQSRRTRNLARLTSGKVDVLVATDVAARGIHIDDISLVIQADAPDEYKTYLHRAGRTGRAGKEGKVVTLIPRGRRRRMNDLLSRAEITAPMIEARPGDEVLERLAH